MPEAISDLMKQGMRHWASGVAVLTTRDHQQQPHAMTASSFTSVSDSPASILVCINKSARMASLLEIEKTLFCVNVLNHSHENLSTLCATPDAYEKRFSVGDWDMTATPKLVDAEAIFECIVAEMVEYGTHFVVIGRVLDVQTKTSSLDPLCYWHGGYRQLKI